MQEVFKNIINKLEKEEVQAYAKTDGGATYKAFRNAIEIVEQATEEYNNGWIPCSVELPPQPKSNPKLNGRYVELYMVVESESDYPFRAFWNGKSFTDGMFPLDVVAWQPLPPKYQPKGEK